MECATVLCQSGLCALGGRLNGHHVLIKVVVWASSLRCRVYLNLRAKRSEFAFSFLFFQGLLFRVSWFGVLLCYCS